MNWSLTVTTILLIGLTLVDSRNVLRRRDIGIKNNCKKLYLEIFVSPLVSPTNVRQLEVQWEFAPLQDGDWIGLFASDPRTGDTIPQPLSVIHPTSEHGWANTTVREIHLEADELGYHGRCLGYHAAYLNRNNDILIWTCLRIEPTWMWDLRDVIGSRRIRELFVPGTHDSSAYTEYDPDRGETRIKKYSVTQDERILSQLINGARYIDLRIGYYPKEIEQWWANHGIVKFHPLRIILNDTKKFLDNTNEIVILDCQEFPIGFGKDKEVHKLLVQFLQEELKDYLVSPSLGWRARLDEIWASGKRLILGYDDFEVVGSSNILFPSVQQKWGNVRTVESLYTYLGGLIEKPPSVVWSAMAELTPTSMDVLLDRLHGLRAMAESVNHNLTTWFRQIDWSSKTNVVAVDFIRGSGIVRAAIEWNKYEGACT